jgi:hypothetical protein
VQSLAADLDSQRGKELRGGSLRGFHVDVRPPGGNPQLRGVTSAGCPGPAAAPHALAAVN